MSIVASVDVLVVMFMLMSIMCAGLKLLWVVSLKMTLDVVVVFVSVFSVTFVNFDFGVIRTVVTVFVFVLESMLRTFGLVRGPWMVVRASALVSVNDVFVMMVFKVCGSWVLRMKATCLDVALVS